MILLSSFSCWQEGGEDRGEIGAGRWVCDLHLQCHQESRQSNIMLIIADILLADLLELVISLHYTVAQRSQWQPPMDGGAWWSAVRGVARGRAWLGGFTFTFHFHALEKEVTTHSSVLAGESQGWGSLVGCRLWGSHRVGHNWSDLAAAAYCCSPIGDFHLLT